MPLILNLMRPRQLATRRVIWHTRVNEMTAHPTPDGLYDPRFEHDACGVGCVVDVRGRPARDVVVMALQVLENLRHRGASGAAGVGDGAGIQLQIPHAFLTKACHAIGIHLPEPGGYGLGMFFMPHDRAARRPIQRAIARIADEEGCDLLGWRHVPTINAALGASARASEPLMMQAVFGRPKHLDAAAFERALYVVRRRAENEIAAPRGDFYAVSLSQRTVTYKGMLEAEQLSDYFPDLAHPSTESAIAVVHSRFSTNTFPSWDRAHPYRYVAHNGEINTLRGNINWMHTREARLKSALFGPDLARTLPVVTPDGSDSGMFDNCLEFLVLAGRSLPHALMMMVPEPWERHDSMSPTRRAFYRYHACLMEAWDGPAAIVATDGIQVAAVLDRNGLRPSRYYVTDDDRLILASEVGVLDLAPNRIVRKGRLQPGRMLLVDTAAGRIVDDDELKETIAAEHPYGQWLDDNIITLDGLQPSAAPPDEPSTLLARQRAFGYTVEEVRMVLGPMADDGAEAIGSMGNDTPLAVLSNRPRLLYDYFKQLFAQVTNPPIDGIREELVTATQVTLGPEGNLLNPVPESARVVELDSPVITNDQLARLRTLKGSADPVRVATLPILWDASSGAHGLESALEDLFDAADNAIDDDFSVLVLSDRGVTRERAPIPALLAVAGLHHHLIRNRRRTAVGLVVETGSAREVHHIALLLGYGAVAINPYLALETVADRDEQAPARYVKAAVKGVLKVISKMGISTFRSYCGAEIFEAVGLREYFVRRYFNGTPSRIEGAGVDVIAEEVRRRHTAAFPARAGGEAGLPSGGDYHWRPDGEFHLFGPKPVHLLQRACRTNDYEKFREYTDIIDRQNVQRATLRSLFELKPRQAPVPLDQVEPIAAILKRFSTGAMSYGSISQEAHEALAIAMNRIGGKSNTGEGGEDAARYVPDGSGDSRNSAIKQGASGRFGGTSEYLVNATEIQIKMAQGAKPGEGGQLPGHKVYPWIAKVRLSTPGVGLISPPPHHDIYSIEDLAQLIFDLKNANPRARISVKLVATVGVGTIAAGVAKARADLVLISGYDGGTGASPLTSIKHAGVPWELGLSEVHQTLLKNDLRSRITVATDGQLKTGRDVILAALMGAEEFGFSTAPLVAMGCIYMRACHKNTCPVGIATQDPRLRERFAGDPAHVVAFMRFVAQQVREQMAALGFRRFDELVGRADLLAMPRALDHWKAKGLDLHAIVHRPQVPAGTHSTRVFAQDHRLEQTMDAMLLLDLCAPAIERKEPVRASLPVRNVHRTVGTQVGSAITRRWGSEGLPDDTIRLHFEGSAGQSFGAFVPRGMTLILEGDANDYVGKGLSGGRLIVFPPGSSTFAPEENIVVGNVAFYGATSGEAYVCGMAGERFCVRNSGVHAVVEAVGDHGCEYMTGGRVVVLGPTGRNFAAGMSGGVAYVLDADGRFAMRCNTAMVDLEALSEAAEVAQVKAMIRRHAVHTGSELGRRVLADWDAILPRFVRVMPRDYKRALEEGEARWATGPAS